MTEQERTEFQDSCQTIPEYHLYFLIDFLGGVIWRTKHDMHHGIGGSDEDIKCITECREKSQVAVEQTSRFGVDDLTKNESGLIIPSEKYWKWFNFWHDWHKGMSDEAWEELDTKMTNKDDISDLLPKTKWYE